MQWRKKLALAPGGARRWHTHAPAPNGHYVVQLILAARVTRPLLEVRHLRNHLLDHLRCLVPDELPVQRVPAASIRDIRSLITLHNTYSHRSMQHKPQDVRERRRLPDMMSAKGEDISNKGGEARKLGELSRMPVQLSEPVADDAFLRCVAVGESVDGREVMEEQREEFSVAAQLPDRCEGPDVGTRLLELACLDPLHQVLNVEDHTQLIFRPAMLAPISHTHSHEDFGVCMSWG